MKETNMEHYRGEIEAIIYGPQCEFTPAVIDGKPAPCDEGRICKKCQFHGEISEDECSISFLKWIMSEYKPEPVLTAREKGFVEFVQKGWLARGEYGGLYHYFDKPIKKCATWQVDGCAVFFLDKFGDNFFPFITWEDEEPWAVEELRKLKVQE